MDGCPDGWGPLFVQAVHSFRWQRAPVDGSRGDRFGGVARELEIVQRELSGIATRICSPDNVGTLGEEGRNCAVVSFSKGRATKASMVNGNGNG